MRRTSILKWSLLFWICLEIAGFVWVAEMIGTGWMLLLLIGGTLLGITLLRKEGLRTTNLMMRKARNGERVQAADLANMPFILIGGILLIIPGFFSDILGLLCFIPPIRRGVVKLLGKRIKPPHSSQQTHSNLEEGRTFDGDYKRED